MTIGRIISRGLARGFTGKGNNVLSDSDVEKRTTKGKRKPRKCQACKTFGYLAGRICNSCVDAAQILPLIIAVGNARKDLMAERTDDIHVLWSAQAALNRAIDEYVAHRAAK